MENLAEVEDPAVIQSVIAKVKLDKFGCVLEEAVNGSDRRVGETVLLELQYLDIFKQRLRGGK